MRKAIFLDRDGIINVDRSFVYRIEHFEWQPGIFDLARAAIATGHDLVVVTNQSGIGRGYYSEEDFQIITTYMRDRFTREGAPIAAVYHCPFHPEATRTEFRAADHPWRKPRPGMLLAAAQNLHLDVRSSVMIGDRLSDIEAGHAAGVGTLAFIGTTKPLFSAARIHHFTSVSDAARWISDRSDTT